MMPQAPRVYVQSVKGIVANTKAPEETAVGLLSTKDAAAYLSIGRTTLYNLINSGAIRTVRIGQRSVRIPIEDLQRIAREGWERPE